MRLIASMLLTGIVAITVHAADPPTDAFDRCAADSNPTSRLACFDREVAARRRTVPPAAAAPVAAPKKADVVGLDSRQLRQQHPQIAAERDAPVVIETAVARVVQRRPLISSFELANGQEWEQTETVSGLWIRPQDQVTLRQGAMGGFTLTTAAGVTVRVRRLK